MTVGKETITQLILLIFTIVQHDYHWKTMPISKRLAYHFLEAMEMRVYWANFAYAFLSQLRLVDRTFLVRLNQWPRLPVDLLAGGVSRCLKL